MGAVVGMIMDIVPWQVWAAVVVAIVVAVVYFKFIKKSGFEDIDEDDMEDEDEEFGDYDEQFEGKMEDE